MPRRYVMHPAPPGVLIVDDSMLVLEILRQALEAQGVVVDTASTLDELERRRTTAAPDVIVLDVQMPEAFGDDVASTLRAAYGVVAPILLMSTLDATELERRATDAGVDGWISKEKGIEGVTERILALLGKRAGGA